MVLAVRRYRNNGELIAAAAALGHLHKDWLVADVTYGRGTFWRVFRPDRLVASDLEPHPEFPCDRQDATKLPYRDGIFDASVVDAPYKLNGTATEHVDRPYGVHEYASADDRHKLMRAMLEEAERIVGPARKVRGEWVGGRILFKCQDQVNAGRLHWQTFMAVSWASELGLKLVEKLDYLAGRPQPPRFRRRCLACGRDQVDRKHHCPNVGDWLSSAGLADQLLAAVLDLDFRPWIKNYPAPQGHAYMRPSSLLIFRKDP